MTNTARQTEGRGGPVTRRQRNLVNGAPSGVEKFHQRRQAGSEIDVSKLKTMSLRKYVRLYDLRDVQPYSSKLDLCKIVSEHLDSMIIDEDQVLSNLYERLRNDNPY